MQGSNGLELRDKVKNVYIGYRISMLIMVQVILFATTVLKHKIKRIDAMIGDDLYRLG